MTKLPKEQEAYSCKYTGKSTIFRGLVNDIFLGETHVILTVFNDVYIIIFKILGVLLWLSPAWSARQSHFEVVAVILYQKNSWTFRCVYV